MAYITITDITNVIDSVNLQAMVDDYAQGTLQSVTLSNICQLASDKADALVSSVYSVPFQPPVPVKIRTAAVIFAAEMLYQRRLTPDEKNPFKAEAEHWRNELMLINAGELSLDAQYRRIVPPITAHTYRNPMDTNIF